MTTRLLIYNGALLICAERELGALDDSTPARRYLDQAWNSGFVDEVLSAGQWRFATRTQQLEPESDIEPEFGYENAFAIPDDHLRTTAVCSDEFLNSPLLAYQVEAGYWLASIDPIYVSYVSNHASFGGDLSLWPADVAEYAKLLLAQKVVLRLNGNKTDLERLEKKIARQLRQAQSADAMESPTRFAPAGSFVKARLGRGNWERGSRTRLIG